MYLPNKTTIAYESLNTDVYPPYLIFWGFELGTSNWGSSQGLFINFIQYLLIRYDGEWLVDVYGPAHSVVSI